MWIIVVAEFSGAQLPPSTRASIGELDFTQNCLKCCSTRCLSMSRARIVANSL